jgi:hypothetical protein
MTLDEVILLEKHKDLIKDRSQVIFAEGVTNASKSFIIGIAFILRILTEDDTRTQFVLAGESVPVLERMFIQNESSFFNIFKPLCTYIRAGEGGARVKVSMGKGRKEKVIYLVGYDNKKRWRSILGLTIHGFNIEEINIADDEFISEAFIRVFRNGGFMYASCNGGDPDTPVYTDYMNKGRPLEKWASQVPPETWVELNRSEPNASFRYYFFNFDDNPTMTIEQRNGLINNTPKDSYQWKTKIIGIRGIREGVIFADYMSREKNIIYMDLLAPPEDTKAYEWINSRGIEIMTFGQDVGGTDNNVFVLKLFTRNWREVVAVDFIEFNDVNFDQIWDRFIEWFLPYWTRYSTHFKGGFIDSAAKIIRLSMDARLKQQYGIHCYKAYKYTIADRCDYGMTLLDQGRKLFTQKTEPIYQSYTKAYFDNSSKTDIRAFPKHLHKDRVDADEYGEANYISKMIRLNKPMKE